eukprot:g13320.t2
MGAPGCGLPWSGGCGMNPIQFAQMQMAQMQAMAAFTAKAEDGRLQMWSKKCLAEPPAPAPVDTEERYYGLIRDYNESQGFGFIECEDAKFRYGMDVFIHRRQMFGLAKGDEVSFVIVRNSQGQPQARHVIKKEEPLASRKDRERREAAKLQAKKQASEKVFTPSNLEGKVMSEEEARRFQAHCLMKQKQPELAQEYLQQMLDFGCEPDEVSFNAVVTALLAAGKMAEAGKALKQMVTMQLIPSRTHYNQLIQHHCKIGEVSKAAFWLTLMKATGQSDSQMSIRSRLFSPLDNSRPDIEKAAKGEATGGFNDRQMPSWTPPGIFFPIMWILIVAPLRAAASMMLWQQVGHLCDGTILALMLHLSIGDTWNTVNNVERRLGVLCVWASALFASYAYYQVVPLAGELLLPTCLWLTVAAALVTDTWRVNNSSGLEPLFPYRSPNATPPSLPDVVSYQHLINAAAATEDEDSVDQWLSEMRNASLSPDVITYTSLMESLVSRGADEQAKRWLQTMVNESVQPNLVMFNVLLASTGRQGDCSRQEQWLQELRRQRLQPDRVSFNTLILGQVRAGELERAEQSLEELRKARCRPDLLSYMPLLDAYARTGDAEKLLASLEKMLHARVEPDASTWRTFGKALIRMFGGDHVPSARDLNVRIANTGKDEVYYEDEEDTWFDDGEEGWYEADWFDEEAYEAVEYDEEDEPIPDELEEAMDQADEAYVSYVESRKRMKELALSRGFYPVVALGPDFERSGSRFPKGEGKGGKDKGKSGGGKGKSKGKGKSGGFMRRTPFNRRPMSGLRRPPNTSSNTSNAEKSTLTGSTAQHGPRFKRYRSQASGIKEVPEEVTMVEEEVLKEDVVTYEHEEQCFFTASACGKAIVDSGATRTIVGENVWHRWIEVYGNEQTKPVVTRPKVRSFKFGGGEVLQSNYEVEFTAVVHGQVLSLTASVVPGDTPFLLARPTLEEWGVIHDYKDNRMKNGTSEWFTPERNDRGHFVLDLMMYQNIFVTEEIYCQIEDREVMGIEPDTLLVDDGPYDVWDIEPTIEADLHETIQSDHLEETFEVDDIAEKAVKRLQDGKKLRFFEVYVDQGNLAVQLAKRDDVEMDGKSQKLREMQNYEKGFTELAANAIYKCMEENWRKKEIAKIMVAEEVDKENKMKEVTKEDIKMSKLHPKTAVSIVAKLHRQLGHPGRDRLITALREAGMHDDLIEVAKSYKCDTCQNFVNKKPAKASALPQAQKFNEILEMDIFHIRWDDKKLRVLAIIDLFSRYEMNVEVIAETEKEELKILSDWINVFGCPQKIRTDASGAHMSEAFLNYMDDRNIKLDLIPKDAHHKMGTVERLHAVRRLQLLKMKQENPGLTLADAAPIACSLRNRLRSVHGSSPSQIVFGTNAGDLGLMDEPMTNSAEPTKQYQQLQQLRLQAAKAFYDANYNNTLRKALLSKSRSEPMQFFVGDWVYYWRDGDSKLEINRWRGPALICSMQPRGITETDAGPRPDIYWHKPTRQLRKLQHKPNLTQKMRKWLK